MSYKATSKFRKCGLAFFAGGTVVSVFFRREVHSLCKLKRTAAGGTEQAEVTEEVRVLGVRR
jgi:hypothetical protein